MPFLPQVTGMPRVRNLILLQYLDLFCGKVEKHWKYFIFLLRMPLYLFVLRGLRCVSVSSPNAVIAACCCCTQHKTQSETSSSSLE